MKNLKRLGSLFLTLALILGLCSTACAAEEDTVFSDVAANAWYVGAVEYVRDNGLMSGTSDTTFSPNGTMTRAMLAVVLYRMAGSPAVSGSDSFTDTADGTWYANAVLWASGEGVMSGYGGGLFGTNDPVNREQIAAILWRYAGSPAAFGVAVPYTDEASISAYAVSAAAWARENGLINGIDGNRFAPKSNATRAQVATVLMNYLSGRQPAPAPNEETRVLVAYFSATGNTENIAGHLEAVLDADLYEIVPQNPYTSADLNYNNSDSRASREQNDADARPAISGSVDNMEDYDVVFLGYPIWWGQAPKIVYTFLENYNFEGKTIVPFCTSGSSGIGSSATNMHNLAPDANWLSGQRFSGSADSSAIESWVDGLALPAVAE